MGQVTLDVTRKVGLDGTGPYHRSFTICARYSYVVLGVLRMCKIFEDTRREKGKRLGKVRRVMNISEQSQLDLLYSP